MVDMARRITYLTAHESCGWCILRREGERPIAQDAGADPSRASREQDIDMLSELSKNYLWDRSLSAGRSAAMPTISTAQ